MSGIAGIYYFNQQDSKSLEHELIPMFKAMSLGQIDDQATFINTKYFAFGVCNSNNVHSGQFYENDDWVVSFNGRLTNRKELIKRAGFPNRDSNTSEARIIAYLIDKYLNETVEILQGIFAYAVWDKKHKQLYICTDRHGYEFIYYFQDNNRFVFASEIKPILKYLNRRIKIDIDGICDIYNFNTVLNNRTPYKNIKLLPHAAACQLFKDSLSINQYWDYPIDVDHCKDHYDKILDDAKYSIQSSVQNTVNGFDNLGIMLSGGLDSRLLAAVASQHSPNIKAFTFQFGESVDKDCNIAEQIAKSLGIEFQFIQLPPSDFIKNIEKCLIDTDGQWGFFDLLPKITAISKLYPGIALINGFLMDTLFKSGWAFFPNKGFEKIGIEHFVNRYSVMGDYLVDKVFNPDFAQLLKLKKREMINENIHDLPQNKPLEVSLKFYCLNRARKSHNLVFKAFKRYINIILPGADYALTDFAFRLPYELRSNSDFYRHLICTWFPDIGAIEWDSTGKPVNRGMKSKKQKMTDLIFKMKYSAQRLTKGRLDFLNAKHSFNKKFRTDKAFRTSVQDILCDNKSLNRGFYNRDRLSRLIKEQLNGKDYSVVFKSLLSVELLHRIFIDEPFNSN